MNLAAGAAGTSVSHLPEIVVLVAEDNVVFGHMLEPGLLGFGVKRSAVFGATFKYGGVEDALVYLIYFGKELPGPVDGLGLEIVSETPVAEHLEHCVVVGVVTHFLEVVVLSADTQALL